jgi:excisionase family DNA binding protein
MSSPSLGTPTQRFLAVWQASARLGVSPSTVRSLIHAGKLPAQQMPGPTGAFIIAAGDLEAYLERQNGGAQ